MPRAKTNDTATAPSTAAEAWRDADRPGNSERNFDDSFSKSFTPFAGLVSDIPASVRGVMADLAKADKDGNGVLNGEEVRGVAREPMEFPSLASQVANACQAAKPFGVTASLGGEIDKIGNRALEALHEPSAEKVDAMLPLLDPILANRATSKPLPGIPSGAEQLISALKHPSLDRLRPAVPKRLEGVTTEDLCAGSLNAANPFELGPAPSPRGVPDAGDKSPRLAPERIPDELLAPPETPKPGGMPNRHGQRVI